MTTTNETSTASTAAPTEKLSSDMPSGTKSADMSHSSSAVTKQVRYAFQKKPFVIGVAGGTASGKSTVCSKIMEKLGPLDPTSVYLSHEKRVICISQDSFYRKLSEEERGLVAKGNFNFDHPSAFDVNLLVNTLREVQNGKLVKVPQYNYVENEIGDTEVVIYPADVVLVEGLLLFYFPEVRDMFHMKIFVDTDPDTRLSRRVMRDVNERHRGLDIVLSQYTKFVKPSFEEFCLPTKKYADIIVPRGPDNEVAIDLIVQTIRDLVANSEISPIGQPGFNHHLTGGSSHHHINSNGQSFSSTPATPVNQHLPPPPPESCYLLDSDDDDEPLVRVRHLSDSGKDISYNRIIEYDD